MTIRASPIEGSTAVGLRRALEELETLALEFHASDLAHRASQAKEPLERGEIWVVVVGQFKRGKSTLVNALLGEAVLPTGVVPVTSVVTHLRWAPERRLRVILENEEEITAPVSSLPDFVSEEGNSANHRGVSLVEVGLPASLLEGGLVLVDTPGVGSLDAGATGRAYAFLHRVDAAVLVLSPDPPLGEAEGAYLRALLEHTRHLLFVLNKVDLFPEVAWREAVAFNRRELARVQGIAPNEVEIVPVSSTLAADGKGGGIPRLREQLLDLVRGRGHEVSRDAGLRRLQAIGGELRARLRVEEKAIRLSDANLEDRLERLAELRRELALRRQEVRPVLVDASRRLAEGAASSLRARVAEIHASLVDSLVQSVDRHPELGNAALVRFVSDRLQAELSAAFDAWWTENEDELRGSLRDAMTRAANSVDATGSTLSAWVEEELGVALPTPPPPVDLVDSHDFYYHVQGMKPELTVDLLGLLLPRSLFRWRLRRRTRRLVAEDLDRNVGRIKGDLLYRSQETVRAFFSELERRALAAEEGIQTALIRASRTHAGAQQAGVAALTRLAEGTDTLEALLGATREGSRNGAAEALVGMARDASSGGEDA